MNKKIIHFFYKEVSEKFNLIFVSILIGIITAFLTLFFYNSLNTLFYYFISLDKHYYIIIPAIGAFLSALFIYNFAPEAEGHGIDTVAKSFHEKNGVVPFKVSIIKAISSVLTMGLGGSGGVEGPISQIGSGVGSTIARKFKFPIKHVRSLMLSGCAAGIAAIFKAPLGGAISSIEVIYREDFEAKALVPSVIAAITSYFIYTLFIPGNKLFEINFTYFTGYEEIPVYIVLALFCTFTGKLFTSTFFTIKDFFSSLKIKKIYKPFIGGVIVGLIGYFIPNILGASLNPLIKIANDSSFSLKTAFLLLTFKLIATSFTIGSGGSGGVFGPSLFIGGLTGALLYKILLFLNLPIIIPSQGSLILVGMSCFFAGVAKAPIGAAIMICEMTNSFSLLVPLLLTNVIITAFSTNFGIYKNQVEDRFSSPVYMNRNFIKKKN
jgi:CIC family chloride channel protein